MPSLTPQSEPRSRALVAPSPYPFPKEPDRLLPWEHARGRLQAAKNYWLATVRSDGRPHVTPVWGVWLDDALYFDGHPSTTWARNIASDPLISIHLESALDVVILEGRVEDLTTDEHLARLIVQAWTAKYGRLEPEPASSGLFCFRPSRGRGWSSDSLADGTAWTFA